MNSSKAGLRGAVAVFALVLVQAALAVETQPVKFNAADQAAARAVVLKMSDFGAGWKGGATKPDLSPDELCPSKRSDLVITGAARSEFKASGVMISSETQLLRSSAMVVADWQRTVGNSAYMACGRREYLKSDPDRKIRFVSFKKLASRS